MNEAVGIIIAFIFGLAIGWICFGMTVMNECDKIGAFTAGSKAYTCGVKK